MKASIPYIDEHFLVVRLKEQDKNALSFLYDHYSAALYGVVLRIVKKETIAEEVLQDAFIKIWKNIGQYSASRGRLFTWMFKLARNMAIDRLRSKEMQRALKTDAVADHLLYIDKNVYDQQQIDSIGLDRLFSGLPVEQSLIMSLLYLKGYTHAQVAKEYQIPLGTVKTRHRMAMVHLRKLLIKEAS